MDSSHHAVLLKVQTPRDFELTTEYMLAWQERCVITQDCFGIAEVRGLIARAYQRPMEGSEQLLVVCTDFITHEAQNALLKVLEEPPVSTKFLFVVPPDLVMLPTLASRFCEMTGEIESLVQDNQNFVTFLSLSFGERIALIETKLKAGDISWQRAIKQGLIARSNTLPKAEHTQMSVLEYVTRQLLTRGASNKMLLEHAALVLPVS
ncbi:MAG: hypothetical protein KBC35_01245 [Candidatus Pacebacteria bacterium]|nr:hypothetical protein [Candidatus Paceibacterota bacterium]